MKRQKTAFASGFSSLPHSSGGSMGGARGARPPPLFLDQTGAQRAEKIFCRLFPPYFRVWMTGSPPPYLKIWIRQCTHPLLSLSPLYIFTFML